MTYRLKPLQPVDHSVRRIAASQIEDLLDEYGKAAPSAVAVHEARKVIKRLRSLLSLVRAGLGEDDLRREKQRLRDIAATLAGARDAQVMVETATALQNGDLPRSCQATGLALITMLEARRQQVEQKLAAKRGHLPVQAFREAQEALTALPLGTVGFDEVLEGFTSTYHKGRTLHAELAGSEAEDERFHDLRKQVQQHWRHLQLLSNAWPKVLRAQVGLAHELAEALGKDHDLAVLAAFVRDNADKLGPGKGVEAYLRICGRVQEQLRREADLLAQRLYAEKPKAIRERIHVYWQTTCALGKTKTKGKPTRANIGKAVAAAG
jgi:CHAD domain-containing protein